MRTDKVQRRRGALALAAAGLAAALLAPSAQAALPTAKAPSLLKGKQVLALVRTAPKIVVAGTNAGAFRSVNGGLAFKAAPLAGKVTALVADDRAAKVLYAGVAGAVWRSPDAGASWAALPGLMPAGAPATTVVNSIAAVGTTVVVGTELGPFVSRDTGATWTAVRVSNLGADTINGVGIQPGTGAIWIAGASVGVGAMSASSQSFGFFNEGLPANVFSGGQPTGWVAANVTFPGGRGKPVVVSVCGQYYGLEASQVGQYQWQSLGGPQIGTTVSCSAFAPAKIGSGRMLVGNVRAVGLCSFDSSCSLVGRVKAGSRVLSVALGAPAKPGKRPRILLGTPTGVTTLDLP